MGENRNKETDWKLSKQAKIEPRLLRQKKKMDSKTTGKKRWYDRVGYNQLKSEKLLTVNMASWQINFSKPQFLHIKLSVYKD